MTSRRVGEVRVRPQITRGKSTGKWFVDIPPKLTGTGRRKRKLFDNRTLALNVARELSRRLAPPASRVLSKPKSGLTFREAVARWRADEQLRVDTLKKRASTLATDGERLKALTAFFGNDDLAAITERRVSEYQRWRLENGRKPRTINSELGTFVLVMRWALKHRHIDEVPPAERIPVRRNSPVIPTPDEVVRILEALPDRLQPLVRFMAETGCRKGEAIHLTWDCVDEVNGYVQIQAREGWTPKTQSSDRRIPLSAPLLALLRGLPKKGRYVFPGRRPDKPIDNFRKALKAAVLAAGIRRNGKPAHLTAQSLRRAHATWQAMRGVNESVLQGLLRHAAGSRVTKQYYVYATEDAKRAAVIQLPIREPNRNESGTDLAIIGNKQQN